jgi:hypothetical protein
MRETFFDKKHSLVLSTIRYLQHWKFAVSVSVSILNSGPNIIKLILSVIYEFS